MIARQPSREKAFAWIAASHSCDAGWRAVATERHTFQIGRSGKCRPTTTLALYSAHPTQYTAGAVHVRRISRLRLHRAVGPAAPPIAVELRKGEKVGHQLWPVCAALPMPETRPW